MSPYMRSPGIAWINEKLRRGYRDVHESTRPQHDERRTRSILYPKHSVPPRPAQTRTNEEAT